VPTRSGRTLKGEGRNRLRFMVIIELTYIHVYIHTWRRVEPANLVLTSRAKLSTETGLIVICKTSYKTVLALDPPGAAMLIITKSSRRIRTNVKLSISTFKIIAETSRF